MQGTTQNCAAPQSSAHKQSAFFRYMRFSENPITHQYPYKTLLIERKLYFSRPCEFNDPYDCVPSFQKFYDEVDPVALESESAFRDAQLKRPLGRPVSARMRSVLAKLKRDPGMNAEWIADFKRDLSERVRILCLCTNITSNVMWSHYADSHKGFAIMLDFGAEPLSKCRDFLHEVSYHLPRPIAQKDGITDFAHLTRKSKEWAYESEWRVVVRSQCGFESDGNGLDYIQLVKGCIRKIYLGWHYDKASKEVQKAIQNISNWDPSIRVFQMYPTVGDYNLEPREIIPKTSRP